MGEYSLHGWQDDKNFVETYSNPRRRQAGDDWYA
jgi:SOS response regulatory protein OraA/RecX